MALDPKAEAALALHRFGLGPRAGLIAAIASDPRGALIAELDRAGVGRIGTADLLTSGVAARAAFAYQQAQRAARQAERSAQQANAAGSGAPEMKAQSGPPPPAAPRPAAGLGLPQQIYLAEAKARIDAALAADIGFVERLVWFWSNHFCVSADKGNVRQICGAYEREVIRANVLGRFGDMLLAVEAHPAMLFYLDNARSIGPASMAGLRQKRGLNENLAREILELHTLGVRTVYTQDDVTSFANVITGWTIVPFRQDAVRGGEFIFNPRMHQPGPQTVIGTSYSEGGVEQGRAVLAALARHPATAKHVAGKLARHFVADEPPPALVERLAKRFLATQGDLKEMAKALVAAPEALGSSACEAQASGRMGDRGPARRGRCAPRDRPGDAGAQSVGRAAVAAVRAQGLRRRKRTVARWVGAAPRHRQPICPPLRRRGRSARRARRDGRAACLDRHAGRHHARRKPPAGARASVHGARVPAPMMRPRLNR